MLVASDYYCDFISKDYWGKYLILDKTCKHNDFPHIVVIYLFDEIQKWNVKSNFQVITSFN